MKKTEINEEKRSSQHLTFRLDDEMFSLEVSNVQEVLDMRPVTRIPSAPDFMKGIINVRGKIVPVIDLHKKFGFGDIQITQDTRIIVFDIDQGGERVTLGALADAVHEVSDFDGRQIEPPPKISQKRRTDFIQGVAKKNDRFFMILDIQKAFTNAELTMTADSV